MIRFLFAAHRSLIHADAIDAPPCAALQKLLSRLHDVTGSRQNATALIATADVAVVVAVEVACFSLGLDPIFFV